MMGPTRNRHVHVFGSNEDICFCMTCGEHFEKEEKNEDGMLFSSYPQDDIIWVATPPEEAIKRSKMRREYPAYPDKVRWGQD